LSAKRSSVLHHHHHHLLLLLLPLLLLLLLKYGAKAISADKSLDNIPMASTIQRKGIKIKWLLA